MGMWDFYRPNDIYMCWDCGHRLKRWEGRDSSPKNYFLYAEGYKEAFILPTHEYFGNILEQHVDDSPLDKMQRAHDVYLKNNVSIYAFCTECNAQWCAKCIVKKGIWVDTILLENESMQKALSKPD